MRDFIRRVAAAILLAANRLLVRMLDTIAPANEPDEIGLTEEPFQDAKEFGITFGDQWPEPWAGRIRSANQPVWFNYTAASARVPKRNPASSIKVFNPETRLWVRQTTAKPLRSGKKPVAPGNGQPRNTKKRQNRAALLAKKNSMQPPVMQQSFEAQAENRATAEKMQDSYALKTRDANPAPGFENASRQTHKHYDAKQNPYFPSLRINEQFSDPEPLSDMKESSVHEEPAEHNLSDDRSEYRREGHAEGMSSKPSARGFWPELETFAPYQDHAAPPKSRKNNDRLMRLKAEQQGSLWSVLRF